jgi:hypothetical protein
MYVIKTVEITLDYLQHRITSSVDTLYVTKDANLFHINCRMPWFDNMLRIYIKQGLSYMAFNTKNNDLMGVSIAGKYSSKFVVCISVTYIVNTYNATIHGCIYLNKLCFFCQKMTLSPI